MPRLVGGLSRSEGRDMEAVKLGRRLESPAWPLLFEADPVGVVGVSCPWWCAASISSAVFMIVAAQQSKSWSPPPWSIGAFSRHVSGGLTGMDVR